MLPHNSFFLLLVELKIEDLGLKVNRVVII